MKNSSKSRIKQLFVVFIIFSIVLSSLFVIIDKFIYGNKVQNVALQNAVKKSLERQNIVKDFLVQSEDLLFSIRRLNSFDVYLENQDKNILTDILMSYSKAHSNIMQIRFIDKNGFEKININRDNENSVPYFVLDNKLQNKAHRYYFENSKNKSLEKVWFSSLDLHVENKELEVPLKPTLRAILPIKKDDEFAGILIVNYFMESFIDKLVDMPLYDTILFNNNGDIIRNKDESKNWSFYSNSDYSIKNEFPNDYKKILNQDLVKEKSFVSKKFDVPILNGLNIVFKLNDFFLISQESKTNQQYLVVSIFTIIGSMLLSFFTLNFLNRTLLNSEELEKLNKELHEASKIANIGFWESNTKDSITWSEGIYDIFDIDDYDKKITFDFFTSFMDEKDKQNLKEKIEKTKKERLDYFNEFKIKTIKGNIKFLESRAEHIYDLRGYYVKTRGILKDITKSKTQEELLINQTNEQKKLLSLFDIGDSVLFRWNNDENWSINYVSSNVENLLGYTKEEFSNSKIVYSNCIHEKDLERVFREVKEGKQSKDSYFKHAPYRIITKNGEIKWVLDYTILSKDEDSEITHFLGYIIDITQEINIKKQLEDSEFRWKFAIEGSGDGLWDWNIKTNEVFFSSSWKKMFGFKDYEIENNLDEWEKRVHPDDLKQVYIDINKHLEGETKLYENEHRVKCKDGTYKWVLDRGVIVNRDLENKPERIIGTHKDITNEKKLKLKNRKNEQFINNFMDSSNVIVSCIDSDGVMFKLNKYGSEFSGYSEEEISKEPFYWKVLIPEDIRDDIAGLIDAAKDDKIPKIYENSWISKSGENRVFQWSNTVFKKDDDTFDFIISIGIDVTYKRIMETQSKLASMGEMIGNIAHQWRQPLNVITTEVGGLQIQSELGTVTKDDIRNCADSIIRQAEYLSETIENFRNFIKNDEIYRKVKVSEILHDSLSLIASSMKNNYITVVEQINEDTFIEANKNEITEALINIFNNCKDVLVEKEEKDRIVLIKTLKDEEGFLSLKIIDSGGGFKEDLQDRIFEPYFTTKHKSLGTGLGLSIADKIIRAKHHFEITNYNKNFEYKGKEYKGACFKITFKKKDKSEK